MAPRISDRDGGDRLLEALSLSFVIGEGGGSFNRSPLFPLERYGLGYRQDPSRPVFVDKPNKHNYSRMKNGQMRGYTSKQISVMILFAAFCMPTWGRPKISPDLEKSLQSGANTQMVRVIVRWRSAPTSSFHQKVRQRGGQLVSTLDSIRSSTYTVPSTALPDLANDSDVEYIAPDRPVSAKLDYTVAAVNGGTAWNSRWTGAGIGVAVIDSGVNPDPNLNGHLVYSYDFLGGNGRDLFGHGEHVAGILAGNGQSTSCPSCFRMLKGLAPGVNLVNLRVLDQNGQGTDSTVIAAIEQAIALKSTYNIRVINLSLGRPVYESFALDPLCQAVEQAWHAGIVVVVAAGNDGRDNSVANGGYGTINAPGNDPYVLTVGAMNAKFSPFAGDDVITTYTSRGPTMVDHIVKPDIVAPGNHISSLLNNNAYLPKTYPQNIVNPLVYQAQGGGQSYLILNGTSMATGVVSGAVADLLSADPYLTPDQVKAVLMLSANKQFRTYSDSYYNLAALSYGQNAQLQQAQQQLQQAQSQLNPTANQAAKAQQQATQAAAQAQAATNNYNAAVAQAEAASTGLATAQSNWNAANTAFASANQLLTAANQSVAQAQAAVQTAQQAQAAAGNAAAKAAAQTAVSQAQAQLNTAQTAQQAANTTANNAHSALNQAQNALNQAQNNVNNANNQVQNALNAMNQANAKSENAAQALAAAQAAEQAAVENVSTLQALVASLQVPNSNMHAQLQQMQSDPTEYSDTQYDVFTIGAGYLDLKAALANVSSAPAVGLALSPVAFVDPASGQVYASGDYATLCGATGSGSASGLLAGSDLCSSPAGNAVSIWQFDTPSDSTSTVAGTKCLWGAQSVWGAGAFASSSSTLSGSKCLWGAQSIWGASSTEAFKCLWGAQSVWGASSNGAASSDAANNVIGSGDTQ